MSALAYWLAAGILLVVVVVASMLWANGLSSDYPNDPEDQL